MKTEQNVKLTFLQGRIRICIQDNLTPSLPSCVVVRGGWQCVRHPDGARRRRRGGLALDGGLVLSAVLVHSCNLRGRRQRDATLRHDPITYFYPGCHIQIICFWTGEAARTFLLCFLRSLGCRGRERTKCQCFWNDLHVGDEWKPIGSIT